MLATRFSRRLGVALALLAGARQARAQQLVMIGSDADERARLPGIATSGRDNPLIRSTSRHAASTDTAGAWHLQAALLELRTVRNSGLPFSLNDGPLWAGRGWNAAATPVVAARWNRVRLIAAPTFLSSENRDFQVIPFPQTDPVSRNVWANPFHPLPESIDLPLRFGDRSLRKVGPGQSSLTVDTDPVAFGVSTENLWWGPGVRNALVISNSAPGFPHAFVRASRPLHSAVGTFDAEWILGQLSESNYFDTTTANDRRSLSGLVITWVTPFDSAFTIGLSRIVMGARLNRSFPVGAAFDMLGSVGHLNVQNDPVPADARDQITSIFARWAVPRVGFEAYAEWARFEEPLSFRDFMEYPGHSEGYTVGLQWAHPVTATTRVRLQGEATYVEPDPSLRLRPTAVTYTSRAVPQGFTNEGQMLGASIGPGASSQWLAGDVFAPHWRLGPYLARIRWDNGTLEEPIVPFFKRQDVTLLGGIRGGLSWNGVDLTVDFAHAARFNYLFQAYLTGVQRNTAGVDLINNTLTIALSTSPFGR